MEDGPIPGPAWNLGSRRLRTEAVRPQHREGSLPLMGSYRSQSGLNRMSSLSTSGSGVSGDEVFRWRVEASDPQRVDSMDRAEPTLVVSAGSLGWM